MSMFSTLPRQERFLILNGSRSRMEFSCRGALEKEIFDYRQSIGLVLGFPSGGSIC